MRKLTLAFVAFIAGCVGAPAYHAPAVELAPSFAFIMGVVPLVIASGAGAEMRHVMGVAVFSGMLGVTFFGLMFTPLFYVLIRKLVAKRATESNDESHEIRPLHGFDRPLAVGEGGFDD